MIDTPPRRHHYHAAAPLPRTEAEARAARVVCEQVGRLLAAAPGVIRECDLAALLDVYEQWRAVAPPEGAAS